MTIPDTHYYNIIKAAQWLHKSEVAYNKEKDNEGCGGYCPGWFVALEDRGMNEVIQRCDDCKRFGCDGAAILYVFTRLKNAMMNRHLSEIEAQDKEGENAS